MVDSGLDTEVSKISPCLENLRVTDSVLSGTVCNLHKVLQGTG